MHRPITPTLFIGTPPPGDDVQKVASAQEAVAVIDAGGCAVLPEGAWDEAQKAVEFVAASKVIAKHRVALAKSGRLA